MLAYLCLGANGEDPSGGQRKSVEEQRLALSSPHRFELPDVEPGGRGEARTW